MAKFFKFPFGITGDRATIPDESQPSQVVSYESGFTPPYSLEQPNPSALDVPRDSSNELYYQITLALQQYQTEGFPDFVTTADNLGVPYPYSYNAICRYEDGANGFRLYQSLINNNISLPTDAQAWQKLPNLIAGLATGTANALELNVAQNYELFNEGDLIRLTASLSNTAASTLQVGLGAAVPINKITSGGLAPLDGGEIVSSAIYDLEFSGSVWILKNPTTSLPSGTILDFGGNSVPAGYILCDGSAISRVGFPSLFSAIGTTWGVGDGTTTFNVPNLSRFVTIGSGGVGTGVVGNSVGDSGGEESHSLTAAENGPHTHNYDRPNQTQEKPLASGQGAFINIASTATSSSGLGSPHNTMQPSAVVNKIIKT